MTCLGSAYASLKLGRNSPWRVPFLTHPAALVNGPGLSGHHLEQHPS
jgi:hypothetical protein